jgi:hypothetical protein
MIPVAILIGLLAALTGGRLGWWAVAIVAVAWPVLLIVIDVDSGLAFFVEADCKLQHTMCCMLQ